nr:hypothetical protein [Elizabethkingia sp. ASV34]
MLESFLLEMEQGISAGSANIYPGTNTGEVKDEWEEADDVSGDVIWD